jgi:hypothetical protein
LHLPPDQQAANPDHNRTDHHLDRVSHHSNTFHTPHPCWRTLSYEFPPV